MVPRAVEVEARSEEQPILPTPVAERVVTDQDDDQKDRV